MVRLNYGRDHGPVRRKLAQLLITITWLPSVLHSLWQLRDWFGPRKAVLMRVPGALWVAIRHSILPVEYYSYQLWQPGRKVNIDNYAYANETPRLFKLLNRPSVADPINDKLAFYHMCKTQGIPTPEVLAVFAPTGLLTDFCSGLPPQYDLFVKARGVVRVYERFRWDGILFRSNRGFWFRPEDLGGYLADRARAENVTLLVQPALSNHPGIPCKPNEALATARLVTGRSSVDNEVTPIFCYMLWGLANKITAHSSWITLVDLSDGRLLPEPSQRSIGRPVYQLIYQYRKFDAGCVLPDWDIALRSTKAAHKACSNFVFIGWDLAFSKKGVMLLEGNANFAPVTHQTLSGEPLGLTKFSNILATHLSHNSKVHPPHQRTAHCRPRVR